MNYVEPPDVPEGMSLRAYRASGADKDTPPRRAGLRALLRAIARRRKPPGRRYTF